MSKPCSSSHQAFLSRCQPAGRDTVLEAVVALEPHAARPGILAPQAPRLGIVARGGVRRGERGDVLRRHTFELAAIDGGPGGRRERGRSGGGRAMSDERAAAQASPAYPVDERRRVCGRAASQGLPCFGWIEPRSYACRRATRSVRSGASAACTMAPWKRRRRRAAAAPAAAWC